jgi:serine/threonine protein kinase
MGRVYVAEQSMGRSVRKVALKTLHPDIRSDPQVVARFHRESQIVVELKHPNTIQFYDFGELPDGGLFIVMEYVEGRSLTHELEDGPLDPRRVDRIVVQICGSLHEAHSRGIVHRDLKPDNIMLSDRAGQVDFVKVLDFGIARRAEAEDETHTQLTKQGTILGTPPYMSPEQFRGQALDARSDVYSLGVLVYEMLCGKLPFHGRTPWEWASHHMGTEPAPLDEHEACARLPKSKAHAVMRALGKNAEDRQADAVEFMREFTGIENTESAWAIATAPQRDSELSFLRRSPARLARHRRGLAIGAALATAALVATGVYGWTKRLNQRPTQVAAHANKQPAVPNRAPPVTPVPGAEASSTQVTLEEMRGPTHHAPIEESPRTTPELRPAKQARHERPVTISKAARATSPHTTPQRETTREPARPAARQVGAAQPEPATGAASPLDDLLTQGRRALESGRIADAVGYLYRARTANGGGKSVGYRRLRGDLERKASNVVGISIQQGRCSEAQRLYLDLKTVNAQRASMAHFSDWCPAPR